MTRRRLLTGLGALGGVALCGCWLCTAQPRSLFHLPPGSDQALWRQLLVVRQGEPWEAPRFDPSVEALDGAPVTLRGFMLTTVEAPRHLSFVLTANPVGCPGCAENRPGMRLRVTMRRALDATNVPLTLTGVLHLARLGGSLPYALSDTIAG